MLTAFNIIPHKDNYLPPGDVFSCLWLIMWSNPKCKNPSVKKCVETKNKSAIFSRKRRIMWSCYPDLNWKPHPYQNALILFLSRHSVCQYAVNRCIFKDFFLQRIISFSRSSQLWQQIGNKDFTRGRRLRFFIP